MYALVDCNNFYVSCERLFNPKLEGKPVVVLSNSGGCVVARSQEAKRLGIPMGAPHFQWRDFFERNRVAVLSSNFALYGDLSSRVMQILKECPAEVEIYSIDEAFLYFRRPLLIEEMIALRKKIKQWVGIPVSIGIGKTKTLAKVAAGEAKKESSGCLIFQDSLLETLPVEEVWGVGRRLGAWLKREGIYSAKDLASQEDLRIRKAKGVFLLRTVHELRGIPCFQSDEEPAPKQSLVVSRSFSRPVTELKELEEALAAYAAKAAEKLRDADQLAGYMALFIVEWSREEGGYPTLQSGTALDNPTAYTPTLIKTGKKLLRALYKEGLSYRKVGVFFSSLIPKELKQPDFFEEPKEDAKKERAMKALDSINRRFGKGSIYTGSEPKENASWRVKSEGKTPAYTTNWEELPIVR